MRRDGITECRLTVQLSGCSISYMLNSVLQTAPLASGLSPAAALVWGVATLALVALCVWPRHGLVARWRLTRLRAARVRTEDALKHFYKARLEGHAPTLESLAGAMSVSLNRAAETLADLQRGEFVTQSAQGPQLTPDGERYALNIIRAHRLWEQYLAEQTGVAESEWHRKAERQEHLITPEQANSLAAGLGYPTHDPHGDPIPDTEGGYVSGQGQSLQRVSVGQWARITHIEDEPDQVYAQIRAMGLYPGTLVRVVETDARRLRVWCNGEEQVLAPIVAANITAVALPESAEEDLSGVKVLSQVASGQRARVVRILPRCRGAERRRLMDLGVLPGTVVGSELNSPAGQLTAYRVRDALIALRAEQAALIQVSPLAELPAASNSHSGMERGHSCPPRSAETAQSGQECPRFGKI